MTRTLSHRIAEKLYQAAVTGIDAYGNDKIDGRRKRFTVTLDRAEYHHLDSLVDFDETDDADDAEAEAINAAELALMK
jgi:hypothetical protein